MMPLVGGFDVAYAEHGGTEYAFGILALFTAPHRPPCTVRTVQMPATVEAGAGRITLRKLPILHALWQQLERRPKVLFIEGAGYMHPDRRGFATVAGEALGVRSVGVLKRPFVGRMEYPIGGPDDAVPVREDKALLGYAWRPLPPAVRPLYVSVGNALPPVGALALVRAWTRKGHATPEPLRVASALAADLRDEVLEPPCAG